MSFRELSWWEYSSWVNNIDLIVIGGGVVGLNAAWHYKKLRPESRVVVLERGLLPTGASTRNAGFACFGSVSELLSDIAENGEDRTFSLVEERLKGLKLLRANLGDEAIGYECNGDSEIFTPEQKELALKCADNISWLNKRLKEITGTPETFVLKNEKISRLGFAKVDQLVYSPVPGQVDSGKLTLRLSEMVSASGVQVITGAEVDSIEEGSSVSVKLKNGLEFKGSSLILATNAFTPAFIPGIDIKPARGQVMITKPIQGLKLKGIFHYDEGYYYFRNVGNRILIGGARNLDFTGEETYEMKTTDKITGALNNLLKTVILPDTDFEIEMQWAGIMAMGSEKYYILEKVKPNIIVAARLSGMGVALCSKVGADAADLALGVSHNNQ